MVAAKGRLAPRYIIALNSSGQMNQYPDANHHAYFKSQQRVLILGSFEHVSCLCFLNRG